MENMFKGLFTALVTPFKDSEVDYSSLKKLVKVQLDHEIKGFVVNGTTAESPTLDKAEVKKIFNCIKAENSSEVPLILGVGSNSTKVTVEMTQFAEELEADGALVVTPYYNKPTQKGLYLHFKTVADSTKLPVVLYNVPGRTITAIDPETVARLSHIDNIIGIKEASGQIDYLKKLIKLIDKPFLFSSGEDGSSIEFMKSGGHGVISVISHVIPKEFAQILEAAKTSFEEAKNEFERYNKLIDLLFVEANPIPVKTALQLMGIIKTAQMRLPLTELSDNHKAELKDEMDKLGLL